MKANMKIKRGRFTLMSDRYCYWLYESKTTEKGKHETWDKNVCGYHNDINRLLKAFVDVKIRDSEATSMKKLIEDIKKLRDDLRTLIDKEDSK